MRILLDTGVLLRLLHRQSIDHASIRAAVREIKRRGDITCTSVQNVAEFWKRLHPPRDVARGFRAE